MQIPEAFSPQQLVFKPVTSAEWNDLEALFERFDQFKGCWCMWWRTKRSEFQKQFGEGNRQALKSIVDSGQVPGLLAYLQGEPIAWCGVGPREAFPVLGRSPTLKPVDDQPTWSIVCFFVAKPFRGRGVTEALIQAAIAYAEEQGARIVEAYPIIPESSKNPALEAFTGVVSTFERLGFERVIQRSKIRPIMRYVIR
jgi:GNAT superfamily N-acetyltransferase